MTDPSEAIIVRRTPAGGNPRRDRYEPRSDGRYDHVEEEWTGCAWRPVGRQIVDSVVVVQEVDA
ncbi:hypothetical protein [Haloarcula sp. CGMCC 1.6347]|uniref:hypothetical protein n=1 Tax=Haloarcula sp. CGMCC 1.6347 TaxID=3111455 RepID=UPI00300F496B